MTIDQLLKQIARENHTTPENVRREMEEVMRMGQQNPDPAIQARWASIPKKGNTLTLEEFLDYMVNTVRSRRK